MAELPAWWSDEAGKKKQNRRSAKQERQHAQRTGGRVQPGSGSSKSNPQDVKTPINDQGEGYLDEVKYTDGKGFRVQLGYFQRLQRNARLTGREGRLFVEFRDADDQLILRLRIEEDDAD